MRSLVIISLATILCSCTASELEILKSDLETEEVTSLAYEVGGFETFQCEPQPGQELLKAWFKSLNEVASIASWPHPDNYIVVAFKNGHTYRNRAFIGQNTLDYSVFYADSVYTGEQLMLESVCPGLNAHNKRLQIDAAMPRD